MPCLCFHVSVTDKQTLSGLKRGRSLSAGTSDGLQCLFQLRSLTYPQNVQSLAFERGLADVACFEVIIQEWFNPLWTVGCSDYVVKHSLLPLKHMEMYENHTHESLKFMYKYANDNYVKKECRSYGKHIVR